MVALFFAAPLSAPAADLVTAPLPGFENVSVPFKVYSGFLNVTGPVAGYDSLVIHCIHAVARTQTSGVI
jgi:hypothetical protein